MLSPTKSIDVRGSDPIALSGGAFGASRIRKGKPYKHRGVDLVAHPWKHLVVPEDCNIVRIGIAYPNDLRFHSIVLATELYEIKILYAWPYFLAGDPLVRGEVFAVAEDLSQKYAEVTNHIHFQLRRRLQKQWIDPTPHLEEAP